MMTPTEFKTLFPEFAGETDERVQMYLDASDDYIDPAKWGSSAKMGLGNLTAHELKINTPSLNKDVMTTDGKTMKKVGELQVQRSEQMMLAAIKNPYMRTTYGQKYLELRRVAGYGAASV